MLATWNPAKQDALRRLLDGLPVDARTPQEAGLTDDAVSEDGRTYIENAERKARELARRSGLPALASDGGLEIPALGAEWEGLHSRRFAGPGDEERIAALLDRMRSVPPERRAAVFHEAVALADSHGGVIASAERPGSAGRIAERADPRRREGFWAPSVWLYPPRWVTEWDLTEAEQQEIRTAWDAVGDALRPALEAWATGEIMKR